MSSQTRRQILRTLADQIVQLAPSDTETVMVFALLCEGKTHREIAAKRGVRPESSQQMMRRLRKRARSHGIDVPDPRRPHVRMTIGQINQQQRRSA